jgi:hypothetical protein
MPGKSSPTPSSQFWHEIIPIISSHLLYEPSPVFASSGPSSFYSRIPSNHHSTSHLRSSRTSSSLRDHILHLSLPVYLVLRDPSSMVWRWRFHRQRLRQRGLLRLWLRCLRLDVLLSKVSNALLWKSFLLDVLRFSVLIFSIVCLVSFCRSCNFAT